MLRVKYVSSLSVLITLAAFIHVNAKPPKAIVGGSDAEIKDYPSTVSLQLGRRRHTCGGTLISAKHVLTAAHCVTDGATNPSLAAVPWMRIVAGQNSPTSTNKTKYYYVKRVDVHRTWGGDDFYGTSQGDIAILTLDEEVPETEYQKPAALAEKKVEVGDKGTIVGWGWTRPRHGPVSPQLQKATLSIIDSAYCKLRYDPTLSDFSFCALGDQLDVSFCQGDSGGPMFNDEKEIIGIISNTYGCTGKDANQFTEVLKYKPWIESVLRGEQSSDSKIYTYTSK